MGGSGDAARTLGRGQTRWREDCVAVTWKARAAEERRCLTFSFGLLSVTCSLLCYVVVLFGE